MQPILKLTLLGAIISLQAFASGTVEGNPAIGESAAAGSLLQGAVSQLPSLDTTFTAGSWNRAGEIRANRNTNAETNHSESGQADGNIVATPLSTSADSKYFAFQGLPTAIPEPMSMILLGCGLLGLGLIRRRRRAK